MNAQNGRPPLQPATRDPNGRMTGTAPKRRAIDACRRAGLPVVGPHDCTCALRGRLVVLACTSSGLEVLWPYDERARLKG